MGRFERKVLPVLAAGAMGAIGASAVSAAVVTWKAGANGNWSDTSTNGWNAAYPQNADDTAQYSDATLDGSTILDVANLKLGVLQNTGRRAWTINSGSADTITLQSSGGTSTISQAIRGTLVINPNLVISNNLTVTEASDNAGLLTLNGALTGTGNVTLTNSATTGVDKSPLTVASINTAGTLSAGGTGLIRIGTIGSNVTRFTKSGTGNLGIFGTVTLADSLSNIAATSLQLESGGVLTLDNTATINNDRIQAGLLMNGGSLIAKGPISEATSSISTGSGASIITVDAGSNAASLNLGTYTATTTGSVLFRGTNLGAAPGTGAGTVLLNAPTLTGSGSAGTSTVGVLRSAVGANTVSGDAAGLVTYDTTNGVRLLTSNEYATDLATANANVRLTSSVASSTQTINSLTLGSGGAITGSNVVTVSSGEVFVESSASPTVAGKLTTAVATGLNFYNVGDLTVSGDIASTAGVPFQKNGAGLLKISGLVSNAPGVITVNAGTLELGSGANNVPNITINGGTFRLSGNNRLSDSAVVTANAGGTFNLNGAFDTIGSVAGVGTVTGGSGTTGTLQMNHGGTTITVANPLTGNLNVIQRGTGIMVVTAAGNDYTGYTATNGGVNTIKAGIDNALPIATSLQLGSSGSANDGTVGTFDLNNFNQQLGQIGQFTTATSVITNSGTFQKTLTISSNSTDSTYGAIMSGALGLTKAGSSKLTLGSGGTFSYTGDTNVNAGTLVVNGTVANSAVKVNAGTLGGSGTITGATSVSDGATVAPGTGAGTLTAGSLSLSNNSLLNFDLDAATHTAGSTANDLIAVTGALTLDGVLNVSVLNGSALSAGSYTLFTYGGALTDHVLSLGTIPLPGGYTASLDTSTAGQVQLLVSAVPEPASLSLLAAAGLLLHRRRRIA